ncbi:RNA methyltransferase [Limnobacter humi]|uniref:RNA methyltransferase n=1 Tax=Limnobacter humi TaxID=1778671 RepID=A0ABT1WER6_9BURK|nr:RNA methyltransferase [Limnobacter humi]MCQ8896021.1 RNA methyltransferase [Limnobacter humi]
MTVWHRKRIDSLHNDTLKALIKILGTSGNMKEQGIAAAEGLHLAACFLGRPQFKLDAVFVPDERMEDASWLELLDALQAQQPLNVKGKPLTLFEMPMVVFKKLSKLNTPTGPLLVFKTPGEGAMQSASKPLDLRRDVVVLDGVQDPGNVGTLLRNCAAAGISQVVCTEGTAWVWNDKVLRAGMGAQFELSIHDEGALLAAMDSASQIPVRVTSLQQSATDLFATDLRSPGIWVFGSEGQGVSAAWMNRATQPLHIPQAQAVESLNVASSSAICLFEQMRQRR